MVGQPRGALLERPVWLSSAATLIFVQHAWYIINDRNNTIGTADHLDEVEAWLRTR
jgi:hypothetical protein